MRLPLSFGKPRKRRLLFIRRVVGMSMLPTLRPGRLVVAVGMYRRLRPEDVVIIFHSGLEKIKRVGGIRGSRLYLIGDNAQHSTDSKSFGWLDESVVRGRVIWPRV